LAVPHRDLTPAQPSGLIPGSDRGGAAAKLQAVVGTNGLDCVFTVFNMVFTVKVQGHIVISTFLMGLFVKLHPPLE
jgi:hypothetical protein